jgi:hypothetical protein
MRLEPLISHTGILMTFYLSIILDLQNFPVVCFSDEDDVSGNQNNCYWPLHSESIARCKHHMQEKLEIYSVSAEKIISDAFSYSENI